MQVDPSRSHLSSFVKSLSLHRPRDHLVEGLRTVALALVTPQSWSTAIFPILLSLPRGFCSFNPNLYQSSEKNREAELHVSHENRQRALPGLFSLAEQLQKLACCSSFRKKKYNSAVSASLDVSDLQDNTPTRTKSSSMRSKLQQQLAIGQR